MSGGHARVNGTPVSKPARGVGPADVLTFAQGEVIRVVRIVACGTRRGPAPEAQMLYDDLTPAPQPADPALQNPRFEGKGRPTGRDRRKMLAHGIPGHPTPLE